jgi:hypothetical protein
MDGLLFALALLFLLLAGGGLLGLFGWRVGCAGLAEALGLAVLLGAGVVSLALFIFGLALSQHYLQLAVAGLCLALAFAGGLAARRRGVSLRPRLDGWIGAILALALLLTGLVAWISMQVTLGWDGLIVWEMKAYLACLNGGVVPTSYYSDPTRVWSHQRYPLFVPLNEVWLYRWLGRCDQEWSKLLFPPFYLAATLLLYAGGTRLGGRRWYGLAAAIGLFAVPVAIVGEGSISSGYADLPLAVVYLGVVVYLLDYGRNDSRGSLPVAAALAALLPWIKQEGSILWGSVAVLAVLLLPRREIRALLLMMAPGALVWVGWQIFLRLVDGNLRSDHEPVTLEAILTNLDRTGPIVSSLMQELSSWSRWGILWPAVLVAVLFGMSRRRGLLLWTALATLMPVSVYLGSYYFSRWEPVTVHIETSLPRLLLHVAPLAVLLIGLSMPLSAPSAVETVAEGNGAPALRGTGASR